MPLSTTGRYRRAERLTGCQCRKVIEERMVSATGSEFIAERPTGAGQPLRMGLRDIAAKPDGRCGEGGRLWSVAEPACPDGAASHLIGPTGFREDAGGYQSKLGFRFFPLAPLARLVQCMALFIAETMDRQSHP